MWYFTVNIKSTLTKSLPHKNESLKKLYINYIFLLLFHRHDGIQKEVKYIREHWFRRRIKELFDAKVLKGDNDSLTGLLELGNFEYNVKSIRKEYEVIFPVFKKNKNHNFEKFHEKFHEKGADWITPVGLFAWAKMK